MIPTITRFQSLVGVNVAQTHGQLAKYINVSSTSATITIVHKRACHLTKHCYYHVLTIWCSGYDTIQVAEIYTRYLRRHQSCNLSDEMTRVTTCNTTAAEISILNRRAPSLLLFGGSTGSSWLFLYHHRYGRHFHCKNAQRDVLIRRRRLSVLKIGYFKSCSPSARRLILNRPIGVQLSPGHSAGMRGVSWVLVFVCGSGCLACWISVMVMNVYHLIFEAADAAFLKTG